MMWLGNDSAAAVRAKFEKDYPPGLGLQLLAYCDCQCVRVPEQASCA
jgi:hypothetical protein